MEISKLIAIPKIENSLDGLSRRMEITKKTGEHEDKSIGILQCKQQRRNRLAKNEQSFRDLWDNHKRYNIVSLEFQKKRKNVGLKKHLKK